MERLYPKEFSRPEVQLQYKVAEEAKQTGDHTQMLDWLDAETPRIRELLGIARVLNDLDIGFWQCSEGIV
jgi:hypothetical protein